MINPNKLYRLKNALVISVNGPAGRCEFKHQGSMIHGWFDKPKFAVGDRVNLQVQFSITADRFVVQTANKPKVKKPKVAPIIVSSSVDSFGDKQVVLRHDNGETETLFAQEGSHSDIDQVLKQRGITTTEYSGVSALKRIYG